MAVRIRMKRLGRAHNPFYRVCATDHRAPRDGRVIEELGYYDPMVKETDARAILNGDRIEYWMSVGALPSHKCGVLIKKYGKNGTHLEQQREALERLAANKPMAPAPVKVALPKPETPEVPAAEEAPADESAEAAVATEESPVAEEAAAEVEAPAAEATESAEAASDESAEAEKSE